jgi:hypothetical protein
VGGVLLADLDIPEIDAEVPLLAGATEPYVTDPHGWPVEREGS